MLDILNQLNVSSDIMDLLFLGDSLIEYYDWQDRFPAHNAVNLGMAGESVHGLLSRIGKVKSFCPEADRIFIMSGINNVAMGDLAFIDEYKIILDKLSDFYPRAEIYMHSLMPVMVNFISEDAIQDVNASLKELSRDSGVEYLDIYSRFVDTKGKPVKEYLLDDGVHLSREGYHVWALAVEKIIDGSYELADS
jgi:lysophospholipase L1-like esterase